jgi:tetratricopeptide (TPR) repeat protein
VPPPGTGSAAGSNAGSGDGSAAPPDDAKRGQAEALNEAGKEKLRGADIAGALVAFQQANALVPDPRYQYNVCLAYEAQEQWDAAVGACRQARAMNPDARLVAKIDRRLELLQQRKK